MSNFYKSILYPLMTTLRIPVRNFLVDYYDTNGNYYHQEHAVSGYTSDDEIVTILTQYFERQYYKVCAIKETLSGLTYEDFHGMAQPDVDVHMKTLFIDLRHYPELFSGL